MSYMKQTLNDCEFCSAKDSEIGFMTNHVARLTEMMAQDHETIIALKAEIRLYKSRLEKQNADTQTVS